MVKPSTVFLGVTALASVMAAACGSSTAGPYGSTGPTPVSASPPATAPSPAAPSPTAATGTTISVAGSALGQVLVDGSGRTVYLFQADKGTTSTCYSACASYWPPVLTTGKPVAGSGVTGSLLGTTMRSDGTTEVLYNGHPLYYFTPDKQAGDTMGQGINGFGGLWYVLGPDGVAISK
jgi:predicted lipoprotein with Yx(FWY)xxD motif